LLFGFATNGSIVNLPIGAGLWLLISAAITQLSSVYIQVVRVAVAWKTIEPLLTKERPRHQHDGELTIPANIESQRLLEVRDVAYRYPGRNVNVLDGCTLQLGSSDKVILEGHSGSGKSTLISLLTGIRPSTRGSILLGGIEQNMVAKEQWGERVVMVPQYHENYLFTETLAFNLLLGTEWPAEPEQLEHARMICHELGLSSLLNKMPSEMMQVVGEMGWTLSHGEKSRVFVARAILQRPDLIILDESLASLDPENTHRVLACVEKHCKAVIIVAHP
jgi:ATP-binding cassette subfamily B protein